MAQKDYPHPYIMDLKALEEKLAYSFSRDTESLKEMIREFVRFHAHCADATALLACNIDKIAAGEKPTKYCDIHIPDDCPPERPWVSDPNI